MKVRDLPTEPGRTVVIDLVDLTCDACDRVFEGVRRESHELHGPFCGDCWVVHP